MDSVLSDIGASVVKTGMLPNAQVGHLAAILQGQSQCMQPAGAAMSAAQLYLPGSRAVRQCHWVKMQASRLRFVQWLGPTPGIPHRLLSCQHQASPTGC